MVRLDLPPAPVLRGVAVEAGHRWLRFRHSRSANSLTHRPGDPALPPATYLYWWLRGCPRMKLKGGIQVMSVLVIAKFQGDVARFRQALTDHGGDFAKMTENARTSGGGIHHRFAVGDQTEAVLRD